MTIDTNPQSLEAWLTARKQELDRFEAHWKDQQRLYGREVMSKPAIERALADREAYSKAMIRNDLHACVSIEQQYGLYGYPPELVSVGLNAACEGKDPEQAVAEYIDSRDPDTDQMPVDEWSDES